MMTLMTEAEREAQQSALHGKNNPQHETNPDQPLEDGGHSPAESRQEPQQRQEEQRQEGDQPERIMMSPGDAARARIAKRARERREGSIEATGDFGDPRQTVGTLTDDTNHVVNPLPGDQQQQQRAPEQRQQQEPQRVRLKVNGKDEDLTLDEVVALAQKARAGDNYLEEARQIRNDARLAAQSAQANQGQDHLREPEPDALEEPDANHSDPFLRTVEALQYRTPEEGAKVLRDLITKQAGAEVTQVLLKDAMRKDAQRTRDQFAAFVDQNPTLTDELTVAAFAADIASQYREDLKKLNLGEEVYANKTPDQLADIHRYYRVQGHSQIRETKDILEASKQRIVKWRGGKDANPNPGQVRVDTTREQRRQGIPTQPQRSAAPAQQQQRTEVLSDIDRRQAAIRRRTQAFRAPSAPQTRGG